MRLIDADEIKKAINTYDTFACLPNGKLYPTRELKNPEMFVSYIHLEDIIKAIDNAPTVEPDMAQVLAYESGKASNERPTGEWVVDYQENEHAFFRRGWKCPVCGSRNTYGMPPFCMYCGARLEKAEGTKE